jgi:RNA-binding protein YhbY
MESQAKENNQNANEGLSRKEITRRLLEESGAKYVQKTGSILMPLSKEQRQAIEAAMKKKKK